MVRRKPSEIDHLERVHRAARPRTGPVVPTPTALVKLAKPGMSQATEMGVFPAEFAQALRTSCCSGAIVETPLTWFVPAIVDSLQGPRCRKRRRWRRVAADGGPRSNATGTKRAGCASPAGGASRLCSSRAGPAPCAWRPGPRSSAPPATASETATARRHADVVHAHGWRVGTIHVLSATAGFPAEFDTDQDLLLHPPTEGSRKAFQARVR